MKGVAEPAPVDDIPHRRSLINQTIACIRGRIAAGEWREWLPSERTLAIKLQVSRSTLRSALAKLRQAGVIRSRHGSGTRIVGPGAGATAGSLASREVAFLSPLPLEKLQPRQTLWIDELRALLSDRGLRLRVYHGMGYLRPNPAKVLRKLVDTEPHVCWILSLTNEAVQRWFSRNRIPAVVAGSIYPGIDLPFSDLDHRAICRHAVGVLLRQRHSRIVFFTFKSYSAGEQESVVGFWEGIQQSNRTDLEASVVYHDGTAPSICRLLQHLLDQKSPPTALLVANAYYVLTVVTRLSQLGRQIPREISVISRDEGSFLDFMMPQCARYVARPQVMARHLLRPVLQILETGVTDGQGRYMMPEFIRGESIGPAPR